MRAFLFLFLLFPVLELALMIKVGSSIGVLPTLLLILGSVAFGIMLLRLAGLATALRARERLAQGELPEQEMLDGLFMAVAGVLFLVPGFISDILGLLCLLPFTRRLVIGQVRTRAAAQAERQRAFFDDQAARSGHTHPNVLEGEYERRD